MKKGAIPIFLRLAQVTFAVVMMFNTFLPILKHARIGLCLFNAAVMILWVYGMLNAHGVIKKIAAQDEDGNITYDTTVPLVQVAVVRVIEFAYFIWRKRQLLIYRNFIVLIVLDVLLVLFLLLDKGSYCYESCKEEER